MAAAFLNLFTLWGPAVVAASRKERGGRECSSRKKSYRVCFNRIFFTKAVVYFSSISPATYSGKCQSIVNRGNKMNYFGTQSI